MARSRLAVALVVPEPHHAEVDGLRRALGGNLDRIAPHITLVPPVNVRDEMMVEALTTLRTAAAGQEGPLELTIGPAASFAPANRVLYLAVGGSPVALGSLATLRAAALRGVLHRNDERPFVPHVTLTSHLEGDVDAAMGMLDRYEVVARFERVDLLRYDLEERRWTTVADAPLGPRWIVGRGGLPLEITPSTVADTEVVTFIGSLPEHDRPRSSLDLRPGALVVVARRADQVAGVALARTAADHGWLDHLVVAPAERRTGVGAHLLGAVQLEMARRGAAVVATARPSDGPAAALLGALGWHPTGDARWERRVQSNSIEL